ncbi:EKC/KEOPS complex subunit GON7 isoform X4 [Choloepus didactylus]|uniref:EKC/KEOPS complex subunit GON7 isoform X4 n=1 Tax=Choloepus didactylus TaxID=27675 RepID=UPI00189C9476|nr:EKC/KEOPS complex subunit GON7 isoform X4 [Choloepus didactylus]
MELSAEYVGRDGKRQRLRVSCEVPGDPDPFHGLLSGVAQMRERVAELLGPLVQKEAQDRVAAVRYGALDGFLKQGILTRPISGTAEDYRELQWGSMPRTN